MRLIASACILLITALEFQLGPPRPVLQVAGLTAGCLLAGSVVADRLLRARHGKAGAATPPEGGRAQSRPGE